MNKVILMGRLTRNPDIRYSQGENSMCVARFTLAVERRFKRDNDATADFISCVAFGKTGEFFEKYTHQGTKVCLEGRIQTGSYVKQDGTKVYTTDVVVDNVEFAESKAASGQSSMGAPMQQNYQGQQQAPPMQQSAGYGNGSYGQSRQGYSQQQGGGYGQQQSGGYGQQQGGGYSQQQGGGYGQQQGGGYGQQAGGFYGQQPGTADDQQTGGEPQSCHDSSQSGPMQEAAEEGFMQIPDGMTDEGLPFN